MLNFNGRLLVPLVPELISLADAALEVGRAACTVAQGSAWGRGRGGRVRQGLGLLVPLVPELIGLADAALEVWRSRGGSA